MLRLFRFAFWCLFIWPSEGTAQSSEQRAQLIEALKPIFRTEFDERKEKILEAIRERNPNGIPSDDLESVIGTIKNSTYNRAYIHYRCALQLMKSGVTSVTDEAMEDCVREPMLEAAANFKIAAEHGELLAKLPKGAVCLYKHRLYAAEVEFPPYEFLQGAGAALYDFKPLNVCLLSIFN